MQHTFWRLCMNMGQKKTHYNYCRHVRKEQAWTAGRHCIYKHFINKKYWLPSNGLMTQIPLSPLFELGKITNMPPTQTIASPHTSLHQKQRTHKYMVSTLHNLILIFHILTVIVLTINFTYTDTYNTNDYLQICCHNTHNNGVFIILTCDFS